MISLSGRALHTGRPSTVRVTRRADDGLGIRFLFPGFDAPLTARDLSALNRSARRATVLTDSAGNTIRTPEHLLAAALFFADTPFDVHCDGKEIPGLDGSAKPWFDLLADAASGLSENHAPRCREYNTTLTWLYTGREGSLQASPAPRFSVTCALERGEVRESFSLESASVAPETVLPARTFIFWSDWQAHQAHQAHQMDRDLLAGAGMDSGLLLAESRAEFEAAKAMLPECDGNAFPLLHPRDFRMPAEAARHKVLDLLGDLALNGLALPRLRIEIRNGGHALHHLLLDALRVRETGHTDTTHKGTEP